MAINDWSYSTNDDVLDKAFDTASSAEMGEHSLLEVNHNGKRVIVCCHCTWERSIPLDSRSDEVSRLMEEYAYGEALETSCDDDRDPDVDVHHTDDGKTHVNIGIEPTNALLSIDTEITVNKS